MFRSFHDTKLASLATLCQRTFLIAIVMTCATIAGCDAPPIQEQIVTWNGFQSDGWYAVDKSEWNDCAISVDSVLVREADGLAMEFDMQDAAHATFRNHDLENRDWSEFRALLINIENPTNQDVGLITYLSNDAEGDKWSQSVQHQIPAGTTTDLRIDLIPKEDNEGAPKEWGAEAWQFMGLERSNIQRIALSIRGEEGMKGTITAFNPRFTKLAKKTQE